MTKALKPCPGSCACTLCGADFSAGDEAWCIEEEDGSLVWWCAECEAAETASRPIQLDSGFVYWTPAAKENR